MVWIVIDGDADADVDADVDADEYEGIESTDENGNGSVENGCLTREVYAGRYVERNTFIQANR